MRAAVVDRREDRLGACTARAAVVEDVLDVALRIDRETDVPIVTRAGL